MKCHEMRSQSSLFSFVSFFPTLAKNRNKDFVVLSVCPFHKEATYNHNKSPSLGVRFRCTQHSYLYRCALHAPSSPNESRQLCCVNIYGSIYLHSIVCKGAQLGYFFSSIDSLNKTYSLVYFKTLYYFKYMRSSSLTHCLDAYQQNTSSCFRFCMEVLKLRRT